MSLASNRSPAAICTLSCSASHIGSTSRKRDKASRYYVCTRLAPTPASFVA